MRDWLSSQVNVTESIIAPPVCAHHLYETVKEYNASQLTYKPSSIITFHFYHIKNCQFNIAKKHCIN